jgi:SAM-dependent methyltransferase
MLPALKCTSLERSLTAGARLRSSTAALASTAGIQPLVADLESAPWPMQLVSFDAIVVTNYLHRPLFSHLLGALADDGILIYETFAEGNEKYGKPANPDFLLARNELLERLAAALLVVAFEQGVRAGPRPCVIQRIAAVGRARVWPIPLPP